MSIGNPYAGLDGQDPNEIRVNAVSLRDYFAGQALGGLLADGKLGVKASDIAEDAYAVADGMLAERERKP